MEITQVSPENFLNFTKKLQNYIDENKTGSIVCLVYHKDKVVYSNKFGWTDKANKVFVEFDTIFRIYSMTKPIVCLVALILYEEGKFSLNDPVSRFLPEFKELEVLKSWNNETGEAITEKTKTPITIKHLLTHTSGLSYGIDPMIPIDILYGKKFGYTDDQNRPRCVFESLPNRFTLKQFALKLSKLPLAFEPGNYWLYGFNIDILGYLIEKLSNKPLNVFLKEQIFAKLNMNDTDFCIPENKWGRLAKVYTNDDLGNLIELKGPISDGIKSKPKFLSGGSGLVSTIQDYLKFTLMLLQEGMYNGRQVVSKEIINLMTQNHLPGNKTYLDINYIRPTDTESIKRYEGWGYGLGVKVKIAENMTKSGIGEYSGGGALNTFFWIDPSKEMISIVLTQYCPTDNNWIVPLDDILIRNLIYDALEM